MIGLGRMGSAMARRIDGAGFDLLLWNRDPAKAEAVASVTSGRIVASASEAAAGANIVVTSLADDVAVEMVYVGEHGIVDGIRPESIAVDTSTVDPSTIVGIGEALDAKGASFLDCPVSGSVSTVEAGALTIMAGGDPGLLDRVRPVLESMAKRIVHVGERGAGAVCKLAVNGLLHGLNVALSEALVLAERAGVDRATAYEVFASGAAGAPFLDYKREAFERPDEADVAFSLELVRKDLELIVGLGERVGAPMRQAATGLDMVAQAIESGMGDRDLSAIAVWLREGDG